MEYRRINWTARTLGLALVVLLAPMVAPLAPSRARAAAVADAPPVPGLSGAEWDPCAPLQWKMGRVNVPRAAIIRVRQAVGDLNRATGLNFVYGGRATPEELLRSPDGMIVIGFAARMHSKNIGGTTRVRSVALAGSTGTRILSAQVVLSRTLLSGSRAPFLMPVALHELAHAVGLMHVTDPADIMFPIAYKGATYSGSTLANLAAVGPQGACAAP